MTRDSLFPKAIAGAAAGFVATLPMTITMLAIQGFVPWRHRTKLEPRRVSEDMLKRVGIDDLSEKETKAATVAAHFAYGAGCGLVYGMTESALPLPQGTRGPLFGLAVWVASYAGWLPTLGTLPPPNRYPQSRTALLIASHLVWGATTEAMHQMLLRDRGRVPLHVDPLPGVVAESGDEEQATDHDVDHRAIPRADDAQTGARKRYVKQR